MRAVACPPKSKCNFGARRFHTDASLFKDIRANEMSEGKFYRNLIRYIMKTIDFYLACNFFGSKESERIFLFSILRDIISHLL